MINREHSERLEAALRMEEPLVIINDEKVCTNDGYSCSTLLITILFSFNFIVLYT